MVGLSVDNPCVGMPPAGEEFHRSVPPNAYPAVTVGAVLRGLTTGRPGPLMAGSATPGRVPRGGTHLAAVIRPRRRGRVGARMRGVGRRRPTRVPAGAVR